MDFYTLKVFGLERKLPIVSLGPKIKVASINLLGDKELVEVLAERLAEKLKNIEFDVLVGPEVKVVPLLQELSRLLKKKRYIVLRKEIHAYMVSPVKIAGKNGLVLDGTDAKFIQGKKVIVVDDVVSSGRTIKMVAELMKACQSEVAAYVSVFCQQKELPSELGNLIYLETLPVFTS